MNRCPYYPGCTPDHCIRCWEGDSIVISQESLALALADTVLLADESFEAQAGKLIGVLKRRQSK
jgi:hypothetical protein